MANRRESRPNPDELVVIQVRVPRRDFNELVKLQEANGDMYLSAYCRRVLAKHLKSKGKR